MKTLFCIAILITISALGSLCHAQPQPGKSPQGRPPRNERIFGPGGSRFAPVFERVMEILTDEQRASLREAMDTLREKTNPLEGKLFQARKQLFEASLSPKFDEDSMRDKALQAAKLEAELTVLRAKAFSQVRPPLSQEQVEKVKDFQGFQPAGRARSADSTKRRPELKRDENGLPEKPKNE